MKKIIGWFLGFAILIAVFAYFGQSNTLKGFLNEGIDFGTRKVESFKEKNNIDEKIDEAIGKGKQAAGNALSDIITGKNGRLNEKNK